MRSHRSLIAAAAVAVTAVLGVTGCGSSGSSAKVAPTTTVSLKSLDPVIKDHLATTTTTTVAGALLMPTTGRYGFFGTPVSSKGVRLTVAAPQKDGGQVTFEVKAENYSDAMFSLGDVDFAYDDGGGQRAATVNDSSGGFDTGDLAPGEGRTFTLRYYTGSSGQVNALVVTVKGGDPTRFVSPKSDPQPIVIPDRQP